MTLVTFLEKMSVSIPRLDLFMAKEGKGWLSQFAPFCWHFWQMYVAILLGKTLQAAPFCGTYNYGIFVEGGTRRF